MRVPIYTEAIRTVGEAQKPRNSVPEVYELIKSDLRQAIELLPESYDDTGLGQERGRATSGAARTLLGKVHLTLEEWQSVLDVTGPISGYSLRPNYIDNFYGLILDTSGENRVEAIFEVQYAEQGQGPQSQIRPSYAPRGVRDGQNQILPTDDNYLRAQEGAYGPNAFIQTFEEGDARFDVTLSKFGETRGAATLVYPVRDENGEPVLKPDGGIQTQREWFVQKWYSDVSNRETRWNIPIFRYAEVLLMRAEAFAELGQMGQAIALANQVRNRAGLDNLAADIDDQGEVREAVRHERRVEFGFEFKRLYDLNRWGILPDALRPQGITINPAKITAHPITGKPQVLYPIPQSELQRNPNATQNAGY